MSQVESAEIDWKWATWEDLTKDNLYELIRFRHEIFVIEQKCIYQHLDNLDQQAVHLMGYQNSVLVAHGRAFHPGTKKTEACLSGICVAASHRGSGLGRHLLLERIQYLESRFPEREIVTSVQEYRVPVYLDLGFQVNSERYQMENEWYLGDPIYHVDMFKPPLPKSS